jgi:hypothetical protein
MLISKNNIFPAGRENLKFANVVKEEFRDFCSKYNYKCVEALPSFVRYESTKAFINIYHGRISYEINVEIGLLENMEEKLSLSELVESVEGLKSDIPVPYQTSSTEGVKKGVKALMELVKEKFSLLFSGDTDEYNYWQSVVNKKRVEITEKYSCGLIKAEAEAAWQKKDYVKALSLYESICDKLSNIEIKRLNYAKGRLEEGGRRG